jgi:hypothetical protein
MDDQHDPATNPESPTTRRVQGGSGAPTGLGQGGPQGNPSGPRDANDPGSTRYGKGGPTGANEPKHNETKEQGDWTSRQGGDQSSGPGTEPSHDAKEDAR